MSSSLNAPIYTQINKLHGLDWSAAELVSKFCPSYFIGKLLQQKEAGGYETLYEGLFFIRSVGSSHVLVRYFASLTQGVSGQKEVSIPFNQVFISEERPPPCISNRGDTAFIFKYNPERQWRRGFCSYNSYTFWPQAPSVPAHADLDWQTAEAIWQPKHSSLEAALLEFKANPSVKGRAISNLYWLTKTGDTVKLFRHNAFMGSFVGKKFFAEELAYDLFHEELRVELPILKAKYAG